MVIFTAEHKGHTVSIFESDGQWHLSPIGTPDGGQREVMSGDRLIDPAPAFPGPFHSREAAELAGYRQLQTLLGEDNEFPLIWKQRD